MSKDATAEVDEGARSATRFIEQVGEGQCAADLSHALHKLGLKLAHETRNRQSKAAGELVLKLKFVAEPNGIVGVGYEINAKEPKAATSGSVFWITKGGNLSNENPRQTSFPGVREVKRNPEVRELDVANDNGTDPRSV